MNENSYTTVFMRSGYSYSKRLHSLVVKNNAMRTVSIKSEVKDNEKSLKVPSLAISSRGTSRPVIKHVRFDLLPKTARNEETSKLLSAGSAQTKQSNLKTPSEDPLSTARIVRKVLYPFAPESSITSFFQTVIQYII